MPLPMMLIFLEWSSGKKNEDMIINWHILCNILFFWTCTEKEREERERRLVRMEGNCTAIEFANQLWSRSKRCQMAKICFFYPLSFYIMNCLIIYLIGPIVWRRDYRYSMIVYKRHDQNQLKPSYHCVVSNIYQTNSIQYLIHIYLYKQLWTILLINHHHHCQLKVSSKMF